MDGRHSAHPNHECGTCEFNDWVDPPSPLAPLLQAASGAYLEPKDVDAESPRWHTDVIDAFADRYELRR